MSTRRRACCWRSCVETAATARLSRSRASSRVSRLRGCFRLGVLVGKADLERWCSRCFLALFLLGTVGLTPFSHVDSHRFVLVYGVDGWRAGAIDGEVGGGRRYTCSLCIPAFYPCFCSFRSHLTHAPALDRVHWQLYWWWLSRFDLLLVFLAALRIGLLVVFTCVFRLRIGYR